MVFTRPPYLEGASFVFPGDILLVLEEPVQVDRYGASWVPCLRNGSFVWMRRSLWTNEGPRVLVEEL